MLDTDEYLHLALHASSVGNHHACMTYLKEVLQREPRQATAIYLLAVQHAELGLFARAIDGMKAALAIEPRLEIARFQLGWLFLNAGQMPQAREHFTTLGGTADEAMRAFAEAMIALTDNKMTLAREKLALGLSRKATNPALSNLMRGVLERLATQADPPAAAATPTNEPVFLGAYGKKSP